MQIHFNIQYRTKWGEAVRVNLNWLGKDWQGTCILPELCTRDGIWWDADVTLPNPAREIRYYYEIIEAGACKRQEWWGAERKVPLPEGVANAFFSDRWRDIPWHSYTASSPFWRVFNPRVMAQNPITEAFSIYSLSRSARKLSLRVICDPLPRGAVLALSGGIRQLGNWHEGGELRLSETSPNQWEVVFEDIEANRAFECKFIALDAKSGRRLAWELSHNRLISKPFCERGCLCTMELPDVRMPFGECKIAGMAVPVFSLRSCGSCGCGDFGDLKLTLDWMAKCRLKILQLLPINDTTDTGTWHDSYPYNAVSVSAFHPMLTDLRQVNKLRNEEDLRHFEEQRRELNNLEVVDYEGVNKLKLWYLRRLFKQEGKRVLRTKACANFREANASWLESYSWFCALRHLHGSADYTQWGDYAEYSREAMLTLFAADSKLRQEAELHVFIQYILHCQLLDASRYAHAKGIALKADIPIGVSPHSAEVWTEPKYFRMDALAGAPPDAFSASGQNWGFPIYRWDALAADGYVWWKRRLRHLENYFDAYRIDHVLGFFRIWGVPRDCYGAELGQFIPATPLTEAELSEAGIQLGEDLTLPRISDHSLLKIFGSRTAEVRHLYLENLGGRCYKLKEGYRTQREVNCAFSSSKDQEMRDGLCRLIANRLFVKDIDGREGIHPRIGAKSEPVYEELTARERAAFDAVCDQYFQHRHIEMWSKCAFQKLQMLVKSSPMLACAEDLGMLHNGVHQVLDATSIMSLEIQAMPKNFGSLFSHLWENPVKSVATISTHDMPTLRGWWEESPQLAQHYYNEVLGHLGPAPRTLSRDLVQEIIELHLDCPSALCILSLQDWLALDEKLRRPNAEAERINYPARPNHYWRYRMHISLERLIQEDEFNSRIRNLVQSSSC